jgi:RNA polymerase sigma-B factor
VFSRLCQAQLVELSGKEGAQICSCPFVQSSTVITASQVHTVAAGASRRRLPRALQQRNARIEQYQQLVRPIALHYHLRCAEPLDDLVQVGLLGLLRAAELFSHRRDTPFAAFARPHIRGAILHYLRDTAPAVRLPRRLEEQQHRLSQLKRQSHPVPSNEQLREAMGLNPDQWQRLLASSEHRRTLSLEQLLLDPEASDQLPEQLVSTPPNNAADAQQVRSLLAQLEGSQRAVLERVVLSGWSYRRTGEALKISPMTVQRRLRSGLARLHQLLRPGVPAPAVASVAAGC